jgi:hypothetical protein
MSKKALRQQATIEEKRIEEILMELEELKE